MPKHTTFGSSVEYFSVNSGKLRKRLKDEGGTQRKLRDGTIVNEEVQEALEGFLTKIETRDSDYGKQIMFTLEDEESVYVIQTKLTSSAARAALKRLPKINYDRMVLFSAFETSFDVKDSAKPVMVTMISIRQKNEEGKYEAVESQWEKEELPKPKLVEHEGKKMNDYTKQVKFMLGYISENVKFSHSPKKSFIPDQEELPGEGEEQQAETIEEDGDELPF